MARPRPPAFVASRGPADSPCVRNCCLDEGDICLGCGRTLDEILRWRDATEAERVEMRAAADGRLAGKQ